MRESARERSNGRESRTGILVAVTDHEKAILFRANANLDTGRRQLGRLAPKALDPCLLVSDERSLILKHVHDFENSLHVRIAVQLAALAAPNE